MGQLHGKRENCDIVEVIADFADDLPHPHLPVVTIVAKQGQEFVHLLIGVGSSSRFGPQRKIIAPGKEKL
jgi:hypothetical protein